MALFITFEGGEGCGKSTQLALLARHLKEMGTPVVTTREPGGCVIADKIRAILLDAENRDMVPMAELFLYAAARAQHVAEVVSPAIKDGITVLCDRFTDATIAYQGHGRGINLETITTLNDLATSEKRPDLTVLLDCPVEIGLARANSRINASQGDREDRFELESLRFHQRVREGYLSLASAEPERFIVIDASGDIDTVAHDIRKHLLPRLCLGHTLEN